MEKLNLPNPRHLSYWGQTLARPFTGRHPPRESFYRVAYFVAFVARKKVGSEIFKTSPPFTTGVRPSHGIYATASKDWAQRSGPSAMGSPWEFRKISPLRTTERLGTMSVEPVKRFTSSRKALPTRNRVLDRKVWDPLFY